MVRKFEKSSSSSHGEEPNNCALAHCHCNNAAENFDRHVTQTLCQNYSLVKNRAYFGSAQNTQLLEVFFARTEYLALAVVDSLVVVGQKRD